MPGTIPPSKVKVTGLREMELLQQKCGITDEEAANALAAVDEPGAYYYNKFLKTTFIKIFDTSSDITVEVIF